jgi:predicted PurR-regulated permease PerM
MTTLQDPVPEVARDYRRGYAPTIIAAGVMIGVLYWARIVFITATISIITALILEPFVSVLVKIRFPRALASFVVCLLALLALFFSGFAAWQQLSTMASDVPALKENLAAFVEHVSDRMQGIEDATTRIFVPSRKQQPPPPSNSAKKTARKPASPPGPGPGALPPAGPGPIPEVRIHSEPVTDYIYAQLGALYEIALMTSFIPLLVYFMLSWRDHIYKHFLYFFDGADRDAVARSLQGVAGMARAFVVGNFVIGVMLAGVSSALFAAIHLPYPFLIGSLSGFLSLVPYAGILLTALPPLMAALATGEPSTVLIFGVLIAVALHLVAMNILYPTVVGARVHLNPLVVTLSLMFWGFLWDAAGLLLAIPITAGLKAVCDNVEGLKNYGRLLGD